MLAQNDAAPPSSLPFWIAFAVTLVCIVGALISGFRKGRRVHLVLGPAAMVALTFAIIFTEKLVRRYEFPPDELAFHLLFAKTAAFLALPVIGSGIWLWRNPRVRRWHLATVVLWLVATLIATGTGFWMFSMGQLRGA